MVLTPSLPRNWPKPSQADLNARPQRIVKIGQNQEYSFCDNSIRTSKYEWYTFPAKFLLEEFNPRTKIANCYFLTIAGMQCIRAISNTNGYPTVLIPLFVVLAVSGVFKCLEDLARHKADKKANSSQTEVLDRRTMLFKSVLWSEVVVGDFVRVKSREIVPADVVVIEVSEPNPASPKGMCYVETKSLDGETNLKVRKVVTGLVGKVHDNDSLCALRGTVEMEHPNNLIDSFTGVLTSPQLPAGKEAQGQGQLGRAAIAPVNVVLRGCVLRSTEWMVGLVVNTGHDVKIMQSKIDARVKSSNLDAQATRQIGGIITMLLWVCLCGSVGQAIFNSASEVKQHWYLDWGDLQPGKQWVLEFFYLLLLHASMVPVSLYVSMALVRFVQGAFMGFDHEMYYAPLDAPAIVRTMTLNEELGQVSHIFSDKTGTLTCNVMNFRKASINGTVYGQGITEIGRAAWKLLGKAVPPEVEAAELQAASLAVPHVAFYDPTFDRDLRNPKGEQRARILDFYRYIALCHEVVPERLEDGSIKLSAPNPDDEALVCAAAYFGYSFRDRREQLCLIHEKESGRTLEIPVLYTIPFTSARKRMSVIVRDVDGQIKVVTKGADTMMFSRVDVSMPEDKRLKDQTERDIDQFSVEGLRCLVLAAVTVEEKRFQGWAKRYDSACTNLAELDRRKRGEPNEIERLEDAIEQGLRVVGATAIEDRLQEGVPECIERMVQAGLKVWVLTGDKEETAINIAVACNLVLPTAYMKQVIINKRTAPDAEKAKAIFQAELTRHQEHLNGLSTPDSAEIAYKPRALIIDGPSLIFVMGDPEARAMMLRFSLCCQAVVCCRVSPDQKREVLMLVRKGMPGVRTLAVGDGANDVAMISAAHIGVGIKGEEGVQAVNASDYAIAQFRFLTPLLLKHGRYNYLRMSNLICFMFYKNICMSLTMFWFNFYCGFSGEKMYTEGAIQFFNLFYTSIPILLYATYDKDVSPEDAVQFPQLYAAGIHNKFFNTKVFWSWIADAVLESVLCCILSFYFMTGMGSGPNTGGPGAVSSYFQAGALCFTVLIVIFNLKMFKIQCEWRWVHTVVILLSFGSWIGVAYIVSANREIDSDFYFTWTRMLRTGTFWLALLVLIAMVAVKDLALSAAERAFSTDPRLLLQELRVFGQQAHQLPSAAMEGEIVWENKKAADTSIQGSQAHRKPQHALEVESHN